MIDSVRTLVAEFIVRHLTRPRELVTGAWLWLAADTDEPEERRRGLKAVLELDPDDTRALLALVALGSGKAND